MLYHPLIRRSLFWLLLLTATSLTLLRLSLWTANYYKADIETAISQELGQTIKLDTIKAAFQSGIPELVLHNFKIQNQQQTLFSLRKVHLRLNLFTVLRRSLFEGLQITLSGAKFSIIRLENGGISIEGLPSNNDSSQPTWLMQGEHYRLIDSEITWHDRKRHTKPILLQHVNVLIHNQAHQHNISIETQLPPTLGKSLTAAIQIQGNIFTPKNTTAKLFFQGKNINLAELATGDLPFQLALQKGRSDFSLWSTWKSAQMTDMSGELSLTDSHLQHQQNQYAIEQLNVKFKLHKQHNQWQLALKDLHLKNQTHSVKLEQVALALQQDKNHALQHFALNLPKFNLLPLSQFLQQSQWLNNTAYASLRTQGKLNDIVLLANIPQQKIALHADVTNFGIQLNKLPSIHKLSLYIQGNEQQGQLFINSHDTRLALPNLFRKPLSLKTLYGDISWQQLADSWLVQSPLVVIENNDIKTKNKFTLTLPKDDFSPHISLHNYFYQGKNAATIPNYLPVAIMPQGLIHWLDNAFIKGKVPHGNTLLHGDLKDFPFIQHQGIFEVELAAQDVDLQFSPDWKTANDLSANIRFFADSLNIDIFKGTSYSATIQQAKVSIKSFYFSDYLDLTGKVNGNLSSSLHFLEASPFKKSIANINELFSLKGKFNLGLNLKLPLSDVEADIKLTLKTQAAEVTFLPAELLIDNINAQLDMNNKGIFSHLITAKTLGYPVQIKLNSQNDITTTLISGDTDIYQLSQQFPHPLWNTLSGKSDYHIKITTPSDTSLNSELLFRTNLAGINIHLEPFNKARNHITPLSFSLTANQQQGINSLKLKYNNPYFPEHHIDINLQKISPYWQGLIRSPFATGSLFIPETLSAQNKISLQLSKLDIDALTRLKYTPRPSVKDSHFSLNNFPALHLKSTQVFMHNVDIGTLETLTETQNQHIIIKQFSLDHPDHQLALTGNWQHTLQGDISQLTGYFKSQKLGSFLNAMQLSNSLHKGKAHFSFALNSRTPLYRLKPSLLSGSMQVNIQEGSILGIDAGLGRILGALDIFKLGKRLRFDFSDLTQKGLNFSSLTADLKLNTGHITTDNLHINAMPAKIKITGETDLHTESLNLQATVLPKFPIAGTIIGTATNVITKAFSGSEHADGILLSLLYRIKGTWKNFTVKRQIYSSTSKK